MDSKSHNSFYNLEKFIPKHGVGAVTITMIGVVLMFCYANTLFHNIVSVLFLFLATLYLGSKEALHEDNNFIKCGTVCLILGAGMYYFNTVIYSNTLYATTMYFILFVFGALLVYLVSYFLKRN